GHRKDGSSWNIGVRHPRKSDLLALLPLDSGCIVTSGDYERFWMHDSTRIHHIFNPETGYPCPENQSLTVWSMNPVEADILSTGLFCFKKDYILSFIQARPRLECIIVDNKGAVAISDGWKEKVEVE
ncbi:MAG: FAD:protein FMN transferase, partial [Chitinivibrionales bacterium]|nr:FAD:protein FMN transferase [Chitinivibrionales bacterium]